ncbi:hypothetical protein PanWU01x14_125100, partial [Parasponia andersonii]
RGQLRHFNPDASNSEKWITMVANNSTNFRKKIELFECEEELFVIANDISTPPRRHYN